MQNFAQNRRKNRHIRTGFHAHRGYIDKLITLLYYIDTIYLERSEQMPVSQAQKKATAKYEKENYDKILTRFPKGTKEKILETGAKSVNSFIIQAVNEKLDNTEKHKI